MDFLYFFVLFGLLVLLPLGLLLKFGDALDRYVLWPDHRAGEDEQQLRQRERFTRTEHARGDGDGAGGGWGGGFGGDGGGGA